MIRFDGLRVFVVEDELLLALSLEEDLMSVGCTVIGPFSTLPRALDAARRETFDMATLDVNLGGQLVYPLADELIGRKVPIIFLTGYGSADLPEKLRSVPRLTKPYDPSQLFVEMNRILPRA